MPVTFSLVGGVGVHEARGGIAGELGGRDAGHLVERRDEADRPGRSTSAHSPSAKMSGSDVCMVASTTMPRLTVEAGVLGELDAGPDADRHHHECPPACMRAVVELDAFDLAGRRESPWCWPW